MRCGGHSVAGLSTCEGGMLIDLAGLKEIDVDPDAKAGPHGRRRPLGRVRRRHPGARPAHARRARDHDRRRRLHHRRRIWLDLVEARPDLRQPGLGGGRDRRRQGGGGQRDRERGPFWGIRGGGGNFGIVTRFDFRLHPLGPDRARRAGPVADRPRRTRSCRPGATTSTTRPTSSRPAAWSSPRRPEEFVPDHLKGQPALGLAAHLRRRSRGGRERDPAAQGPRARGRPDPAHALHGVPGDARRRRPRRAFGATGGAST